MASISTPQQQAGILSFYDAPERGPKLSPKVILILVAAFTIIVIVANHFV